MRARRHSAFLLIIMIICGGWTLTVLLFELGEGLIKPLAEHIHLLLPHAYGSSCSEIGTWVAIIVCPPVDKDVLPNSLPGLWCNYPAGRQENDGCNDAGEWWLQ